MMVISVLSNGDIMVQDYSHQDDRQKLVKMLQKMGIKTEAIIDSLCG